MTDDTRDKETGRFLPKNEFWKARSSHGRNPKFETADMLADACEQYFQWVAENPLHEAKAFAYQGTVAVEAMPKMRAMTIMGLCLFIGITQRQWMNWRLERPDFLPVMEAVEEAIRTQKFEGAAADLLNANIIARDLGLADRSEVTGKDGADLVPKQDVTSTELARQIAFILREAMQEQGK